MAKVQHKAVVDAPRDIAFGYVNEYPNVPRFMFGISRFDPMTQHTEGLGSRFSAEMVIGPKSLKAVVETTVWVENERIHLDAVDGFAASTRWCFADVDGGTEIDVEFDYKLPGGLAGRALGVLLEPFVGQAIRHTEHNLSTQIRALT
ncbi:SRPBCC family protein [Gordonia sp. NPDC003424]